MTLGAHVGSPDQARLSDSRPLTDWWLKEVSWHVVDWNLFTEHLLALNVSVQVSSVTQSCPTLCDPMNRSTPGLPVHHHLLESTQTHVHRVGDASWMSHMVFF